MVTLIVKLLYVIHVDGILCVEPEITEMKQNLKEKKHLKCILKFCLKNPVSNIQSSRVKLAQKISTKLRYK